MAARKVTLAAVPCSRVISPARPRGSRSLSVGYQGRAVEQARIAFWFLLFGGRHRTSCSKVQCSVCWRGVCTVLGRHGEVRGILISVLGHSGPCLYGSGAGRVSISHLGRISCSRAPWRSARTPRAALRLNRGRGGNARSSPTQKACGGQPRSRRPPGGRVAA